MYVIDGHEIPWKIYVNRIVHVIASEFPNKYHNRP